MAQRMTHHGHSGESAVSGAGAVDLGEPPPARVVPGSDASRLLLVCDHARNWIPPRYGDLGLAPADLARHIAYDIGAEALTVALAEALGAWAVLSTFSRLLIDPNRGENAAALILEESDGTTIPGNARLDAAERELRIARYYLPYHRAVGETIEGRLAAGVSPIVVSIHSFTPIWKGEPRPWHVGVLWDSDPGLAHRVFDALSADASILVGDNEPYSGKAPLHGTLDRHATRYGLSHVLLEIRQDLIAAADGVQRWADRLIPILRDL